MDDAPLQTALGIHRLNDLHHAAQTVRAEQINIQNAPTFEVIQHIQPKFATLMLPNPDTQNVFSAVHGDAQNHIGRLGHIAVILLDLVMDGKNSDDDDMAEKHYHYCEECGATTEVFSEKTSRDSPPCITDKIVE